MSSKTVSVPKYRHHKGSGQAFVQVKGQRHYLGVWDSPKSKERYAAFVAELAVKPGDVQPITPANPTTELTIVELCDAYLTFAKAYYRVDGKPTRTIQGILAAIRVLKNLYGRTLVADFGPLCLLAIQADLATKKLSRNYVNKTTSYIKRVFKWGVSRQTIPPSVYTALVTVEGLRLGRSEAKESAPVQPVADDVLEATVPFLPKVMADMVMVQRLTGCRPGEVCQLRPADIDRSGDVWVFKPMRHKTQYRGLDRNVFIGPKAQAILLPYLLRAPESYCFSPMDSVKKHHAELRIHRRTKVQPSQQCRKKRHPKKLPGESYGRQSYCQAILRAINAANAKRTKEAEEAGVKPVLLPRWHPNQLRHSAASEIRRQFGLEAAQVSLGHAKADTTQIYAERDSKLAIEVAKKIG
jgi:integrase